MYFLNKTVSWCASPLGLLFIGLAGAWILGRIGRKNLCAVGRWVGWITVVGIWLMSCGGVTRIIGTPLEVDEIDERLLPQADAIVLLGGGMGVHEKCGRAEMFGSADRVWMAARVYKAGKAPLMFVTGTNNIYTTTAFLSDLGVPTNALRYVNSARNTEEEARAIAQQIRVGGLGLQRSGRILLVTSAWHMKRAKMMFEKYAPGLEVVAAPTDYEMHCMAERPIEFGDFLPSADALARNSYAVKEWVARFGYSVFR